MLFIINESVLLWNICKSLLVPKTTLLLSGNLVKTEPVPGAILPSNKKYVAVPPEPSSDWNNISLSLALFFNIKSPTKFSTIELLALWYISKSPLFPKTILLLSPVIKSVLNLHC